MITKKSLEEDLSKIGLFIIFDSLVLHEVISASQPDISSLKLSPSSNISNFLKTEWEKILKKDYQPVFNLSYSVLLSLPTSPDIDAIFKRLIAVVLDIISSGVLLKHDLMGRIYHKILLKTTGKYYATYYTSIPAAWILSNLAIKTPNPDSAWNFENLENIKDFKVLDPACGSGTLLSGTYMAMKDKYILDRYNCNNPQLLDLASFHKIMLENVLNGWDILDYAGHLTLTSLALHNPKALFDNSNIWISHIGKVKGGLSLGSLDWFENQMRLPVKGFITPSTEKGMKFERERLLELPRGSVNVVIMNPPFSRSAGTVNVKFGYEEEKIMQAMNKQLRKLGEKLGYEGIGQAGLGAYFIVLGNKLLKQGGRLALVIPRAILSGVSWEKIRKELFLKKYEVEYIVSNYDPGDEKLGIEPWNWSENTDLGEVLIVARKTKKLAKERYVTFLNLWNKPKNELESLKIVSDSIKARNNYKLNFLEGGSYEPLKLNKEVGVVYNVSQKYLDRNFLIPCLFAHPDLNKLTFELIYNNLIPLIPLGNITDKLGVDRKQIETSFKLVSHRTAYPILWGHPESLNTIELNTFQYALLKEKKAKTIYENGKGNLLIAERIWTTTLSTISLYSRIPILATMFWEVTLKEESAKILSMWLNSTFGFLLVLAFSINNKGNWFNLKKGHLSDLPVLDISYFPNQRKQVLNLFTKVKNISFKSFPLEFELARKGKGIRKQIDDVFIKALGLNINLEPYYEMLSKEPMISLKRL